MRKLALLFSVIYFACLNISFAAGAEQKLKIGVLDVPQILQHSSQMERQAAKLKKQFKPRSDKMTAIQKTIADNEAKLKRDATIMSQAEVKKLRDKVVTQRKDLRRMEEDYYQDAQNAQKEVMNAMMVKINNIVQKIAKNEHYDLILQRGSIAFASERVDITKQVIKELEKS